MAQQTSRSGFTIVEIVLVVIVLGIIGLLGYVFVNQLNKSNDTAQESSQTSSTNDSATAPEINSVEDLDAAQQALDESDLETTTKDDSSQLDDELSNF